MTYNSYIDGCKTRNTWLEVLLKLRLFRPGLILNLRQQVITMSTLTLTWRTPRAKIAASHASTTASILQGLSKHHSLEVRMAVADNENTSANTSMQLAHDSNADLRYAMAENHHMHKSILDFLTKDINPFVADRAQKTILRLKQEISKLASQLKNN